MGLIFLVLNGRPVCFTNVSSFIEYGKLFCFGFSIESLEPDARNIAINSKYINDGSCSGASGKA